jgi:hypothetical protein
MKNALVGLNNKVHVMHTVGTYYIKVMKKAICIIWSIQVCVSSYIEAMIRLHTYNKE